MQCTCTDRQWRWGQWVCSACLAVVRWYPYKGWHHYGGHRLVIVEE